MSEPLKIIGVIQKGVGQGAFFTCLDWVVDQFEKVMESKPFPGTLNVRVRDEDLPKLERFFTEKDFEIIPTDPQFCSAHLKKVWVNGLPGAAVFPSKDVHIYGEDIVEIMSSYHIKEALHLVDGDEVIITDLSTSRQIKGGKR